jgi:adenosylcobinamide kinase/adenosylcobinamide-phosphate guanylyltransferase
MGKVVLVTGGAKSGKSLFGEKLASGLGSRVVYVATAEAYDAEMATRVGLHRARRPAGWVTLEEPLDLQAVLARLDADIDAVLVDCLTLWISNRLLALGSSDQPDWWDTVGVLVRSLIDELGEAVTAAREAPWHLVLVANEVGWGIVPPTPLGRAFRDLQGALSQRVAAQADAVFLVVAGLGVEVKHLAVEPQVWARTVKAPVLQPDSC